MINKVPVSELKSRMTRFKQKMCSDYPDWQIAVIFSKINQYYFTGTMQDGMLLIPREEEPVYWVRRSYERAVTESLFNNIKPMDTYRDAAAGIILPFPDTVYIETEVVTFSILQRFQKYFPYKQIKPLDMQISAVRAVKSSYELSLTEHCGKIHSKVLEDLVPGLLKEGMSEAELAVKIYDVMISEGHQGTVRFGMFDTEIGIGHICFGESSIYPTYFNGPGGHFGISQAAPLLGSRDNKLKYGDLVFVDVGCGYEGYQTDKTMTYMFGKSLPGEVIAAHNKCRDIQYEIAGRLKPGEIPANIYNDIMNGLDADFLNNFMGYKERKVKFLGHGVGLLMDELPVIADKFIEPVQENMVFALEPKKGIKGVGMVGVENTFKVTALGGVCLTGNHPGLMKV